MVKLHYFCNLPKLWVWNVFFQLILVNLLSPTNYFFQPFKPTPHLQNECEKCGWAILHCLALQPHKEKHHRLGKSPDSSSKNYHKWRIQLQRRSPRVVLAYIETKKRTVMCKICKKKLRSMRFKNMFKRNINNHNMKLRYKKKFRDAKIRTNRLYKSSIPYMQRYLNSEHKKTEHRA